MFPVCAAKRAILPVLWRTPVPVPNTPAAASTTAALPMESFLEQIQTERMFASPVLNR